jgi:hypothetical protein
MILNIRRSWFPQVATDAPTSSLRISATHEHFSGIEEDGIADHEFVES